MSEEKDLLDNHVNQGGYTVQTLPNATATLVLGIISIVGCIFYGIPGLVCGIIALVLHKKDKKIYTENPAKFEQSYKTAKAGYICAIIGVSLSALYFVILLIYIIFAVSVFSGMMVR